MIAVALAACSTGAGGATDPNAAPTTFTVGVGTSIHTLDPNQSVAQEQLQILNQVAGTLTNFTSDLLGIEPGLAESWEVSEDGLVYTFTLKSGLVFSDGEPLTASDFAASLQREIDDQANANAGMVANWSTASAPDDLTVVLELSKPQPSVLSLLADPELGMVMPKGKLADPEFFLKPVSAGPYMVDSFDATNGDAVLAVNPNYSGPTPAVAELHFVYIKDSNTRIVQLRGENIDLALNLPPNALAQLTGSVAGSVTPGFGGNFMIVNNKDAILSDVRVRQALSLAIDRQQLSDVVWLGGAAPLYGFWPNASALSADVLPAGVDIDGAKALLKGTACENGCELTLALMPGAASSEDMAAIIAENLKAIGITMNVELTDGAVMGEQMSSFTYQLLLSGLYDYVDRTDILLAQGIQSDGGTNALFSGYNSPQMDALISTAVSTDGDERATAETAINELFGTDLPYIPLVDWVFVNGENTAAAEWVSFDPSGWLRVATED